MVVNESGIYVMHDYGQAALELHYGLLVAQNGDATLIEAVWILLGGDVKIDGEDEVRPGEVQVHGQSHLHRDTDGSRSVKVSPAEFL